MRLIPLSFSQVTLFWWLLLRTTHGPHYGKQLSTNQHSSSKFFPACLCIRGSFCCFSLILFFFLFSDALRASPQNRFSLSLSFICHNHHPHHSFVELCLSHSSSVLPRASSLHAWLTARTFVWLVHLIWFPFLSLPCRMRAYFRVVFFRQSAYAHSPFRIQAQDQNSSQWL